MEEPEKTETETPAATEPNGILSAVAGDKKTAEQPAEKPKEEPKWFLADGVPGTGDVPEWFKADKYKTVDEQAKAFLGLEKKLGSAPAEYSVNLPQDLIDAGVEFDAESALAKDFFAFARSANLPQKKVDEMLGIYARSMVAERNQSVTDMLAELGEQGRKVAAELHAWSTATLDNEQQQWLDRTLRTADDIYTFQSVLQKLGMGAINDRASSNGVPGVSEIERLEAEIHEAMRDPRYSSDPAFEKQVRAKFARLVELGG